MAQNNTSALKKKLAREMIMPKRKRILIHHLAGQYPLAGVAWQALHYLLGLKRLGHDVYYIEDSGAAPYNPIAKDVLEDYSYNVNFIRDILESFDLGDRWAYLDMIHNTCYGLSLEKLRLLYREADALINLCGATMPREEHLHCPIRIYLETDPAGRQIELSQGNENTKNLLAAHTHHYTYAENLGYSDCPLPAADFRWRKTRPPVILDLWPQSYTPHASKFTTIATLEHDKQGIVFQGQTYYWSKHLNFLLFRALPTQIPQRFEIAIHTDNKVARDEMTKNGWSLVNAYEISLDLASYQSYVRDSRGEFTVAKDLFARTRSGWFSDRSVCYLAMGKPVVTLETGFSKFIPTGQGLFAYSTLEDALEAVHMINSDYSRHCQAAQDIATEYFSSDRVLAELLDDVGL